MNKSPKNHRQSYQWHCIKNCGACCHLQPSARPDLDQYLTSIQLQQYLSLVGKNGWCIHYDQHTRQCLIYEDRPLFCRVTPDNFRQMFQIPPEQFNLFAIECCQEQIMGVYGENSQELKNYQQSYDD